MTEQEAIVDLQRENKILSQYAESKFQKEIFAKRIERNNIAIKALEKQIPQTFFENKFNKMHIGDTVNGICPVCFTDFVCITPKYYKKEGYGYCKQCGQKLDWSEEEKSQSENEAIDLDKLIEDAKVLAKEKDTLARTFRNFKDYRNPKSTITSGAEKAQKEAEQYEHISKFFEELKAYRAIGTIEEFKALKEKSVGKKPVRKPNLDWTNEEVTCPSCSRNVSEYRNQYCDCGQKLDWGE